MKIIDDIKNTNDNNYISDTGYFAIRNLFLFLLDKKEIKENEIVIYKFIAPVTPIQFDSNVYKKVNGELEDLGVCIPEVYLFRVDTMITALNKIIIYQNEKQISKNK